MSNSALRSQLVRMLNGDFRVGDISDLFLAMRDHNGGRETVREIGDFVAHRGDRFKGITTRMTRSYFAVIRFHFPKTPTIVLDDLPANFADVLYGTFERVDNSVLRDRLGLKRQIAAQKLEQIGKRITPDGKGKYFFAWPTPDDIALIQLLSSLIISKAAFDDDRLFDEFSACLIENGLLEKEELKTFVGLKPAIALFAISRMHRCDIDLNDGTKAILRAASDSGRGKMAMSVMAPVGKMKVASFMFETNLVATECCTATLMAELQGHLWECDLEITSDRKLTKLG